MPVVVWFLRWTVGCCDFKRVGEWLFPEQSRSWLRHSNPCAPNHTALLSARWYNQGNTSKFSLWSWFAHTRAYNMCRHVNRNTFIEPLANCTWILGSMTHNGSAIRSLSLALNQTLLRLVCGNGAFNCSPSTCLFAWSHLRDRLWASCPPECQYLLHPPSPHSFLSTISTSHLHPNLPASISGAVMCDISWDTVQCLGWSPEPMCILLLNRRACTCICVFKSVSDICSAWRSSHVVCNRL